MTDLNPAIEQLLARLNVSFISSVDAQGFPNTKAMLMPRRREGLKTIFYSTNTSSVRVAQYRRNNKSCLYFCNRDTFQGVMLKGIIEVLEDQTSKDALWEKGDEQYYPLGVSDPDYCTLKFTAFSGRYYNGGHSQDFSID